MAQVMDLPEQRSEIALPQAVPGASAAPEAAAAAQSSFEADVHGQGDERRGAAARSRDLDGPAPKMQWLAGPPEADTHPHFEDNRIVTDRASDLQQDRAAQSSLRSSDSAGRAAPNHYLPSKYGSNSNGA